MTEESALLQHEAYVIVLKDRNGKARGLEKVWLEKFFLTEKEATGIYNEMMQEDPVTMKSFKVVRVLITYDEVTEGENR